MRIQPRPAPPKRKSPWAVDPAAERIVDQFDQARVTRTLRSRDGLRSLQKTAVECLQLGLTESANLKDAERFGASARSRWHPLEWACRHACDDLLSIAQRVAEELRVAIDTGQRPDQRIVARYRRMLVCVDELVAAKAETIGVNRESLRAPASSNGYQVVAPAGAYAAPWQQAEAVAAAALQQFGFFDARVTGAGADGGLDVTGQDVAAQVKYTGTPVGRPVIQQLLGAANGRKTAFFSLSGYTQQAVEEADARGMALFLITLPSSVRTQNAAARILVRGHDRLGDAARILREWATEGEPPS